MYEKIFGEREGGIQGEMQDLAAVAAVAAGDGVDDGRTAEATMMIGLGYSLLSSES